MRPRGRPVGPWWVLQWLPAVKAYRILGTVTAEHAPGAVTEWFRLHPTAAQPGVIARPQGDRTVPLLGPEGRYTWPGGPRRWP